MYILYKHFHFAGTEHSLSEKHKSLSQTARPLLPKVPPKLWREFLTVHYSHCSLPSSESSAWPDSQERCHSTQNHCFLDSSQHWAGPCSLPVRYCRYCPAQSPAELSGEAAGKSLTPAWIDSHWLYEGILCNWEKAWAEPSLLRAHTNCREQQVFEEVTLFPLPAQRLPRQSLHMLSNTNCNTDALSELSDHRYLPQRLWNAAESNPGLRSE